MKNFAERIRAMVSSGNPSVPPAGLPIDFVKSKKGMLKEFSLSRLSGNAIGIYASVLGEGMFLTVVEEFESNNRIVFNRYDMSGAILSRHDLSVDEIQMVCPLNQKYRQPSVTSSRNALVR